MLNKKQKIRGTITTVQPNGLGVMRFKNESVYVKEVLENEEVEAIVTKKLKEGYLAEVIKIHNPSSIRTKVKCPKFSDCGGCSYLHMLYPFELKLKTQQVKDQLERQRLHLNVENVIGMKQPEAYRNKLILSFGISPKQGIISGFYEPSSHRIVSIDHCMMHDAQTNEIIRKIKDVIRKSRIDIYNETTRQGFLRHLVVRQGFLSKELMLTFVVASREFKGKKKFVQTILDTFPKVTTIVQNVNKRNTSIVLGDEEFVLYGRGYIVDDLCGLKFQMSSRSFYQINHEQCEKLYIKALDLADITKEDVVVDTYCGIGTISLLASQKAKHVYGVEINADAIENAKVNQDINNIHNASFICDDASHYMQLLASKKTQVDVVIMDPAREGSDADFLNAVLKLKPKKIVYISCNPETQIRDINMIKKDYSSKTMYLYDMFPRTNHIESIVLLKRR